MTNDVKRRRLLIRLALVVVWIAIGVLLFVMNRGHSILIDNRNLSSPELRAPDMIKVTMDKLKPLEFFRGDRDMFEVGGGRHRITVEFSDGKPPFTTTFTLPLGPDMFILSIPKMINGIEPYFEVFNSQPDQ
ncbi:MAG: hypothetical protein FWC45_06320 [Treponema sp.]|nr:hypothetical protein [Treponema sp.]